MTARQRVPQKTLDMIRAMLIWGATHTQISSILGCSVSNVSQLVERYKLNRDGMTPREFKAYMKDEIIRGRYFGEMVPMTHTHLCEMAEHGVPLDAAARIVGLTEAQVEDWFRESPEMKTRYDAYAALWQGTMVDEASRGAGAKPVDKRKMLESHPETRENFKPAEQNGNQIQIIGLIDRRATPAPRDVTPPAAAIEGGFRRLPRQEDSD